MIKNLDWLTFTDTVTVTVLIDRQSHQLQDGS